MMIRRVPSLLVLCLGLATLPGCSWFGNWDGKQTSLDAERRVTANATVDPSPEGLYGAGVEALQAKRYAAAADYFDQIERDHPYSTWATNAKLMSAYAEYQRNRYTEAHRRAGPLHPAASGASRHRLCLSTCARFATMSRSPMRSATSAPRNRRMAALQDVVNRFPDTAYARDARLKIDLGRDHLAGKEMNIGRYYQRQRLYAAAIGRFKRVVEDYQTTNHVPEALHRLTEIYLTLGLTDEARKTASVLGHNYPGQPLVPGQLRPAGGRRRRPRREDRPGFVRRAWNWVF